MTNVLPPLRDKEYGGAWSIHDPKTMDFLQNIPHKQGNTEQFVNDYADWICENKTIKGIEKYKIKSFSAGTTETFDKFYHHYLNKRLRIHKGEYFYHHMMKRDCFQSSAYMDEDQIQKDWTKCKLHSPKLDKMHSPTPYGPPYGPEKK